MTTKPSAQPTVSDPDNVPETFCDGPIHLDIVGDLATLTFFHERPDPASWFSSVPRDPNLVVRARVVLTTANLIAIKSMIDDNTRGKTGPIFVSANTSLH
jgi:hypothetical protein